MGLWESEDAVPMRKEANKSFAKKDVIELCKDYKQGFYNPLDVSFRVAGQICVIEGMYVLMSIYPKTQLQIRTYGDILLYFKKLLDGQLNRNGVVKVALVFDSALLVSKTKSDTHEKRAKSRPKLEHLPEVDMNFRLDLEVPINFTDYLESRDVYRRRLIKWLCLQLLFAGDNMVTIRPGQEFFISGHNIEHEALPPDSENEQIQYLKSSMPIDIENYVISMRKTIPFVDEIGVLCMLTHGEGELQAIALAHELLKRYPALYTCEFVSDDTDYMFLLSILWNYWNKPDDDNRTKPLFYWSFDKRAIGWPFWRNAPYIAEKGRMLINTLCDCLQEILGRHMKNPVMSFVVGLLAGGNDFVLPYYMLHHKHLLKSLIRFPDYIGDIYTDVSGSYPTYGSIFAKLAGLNHDPWDGDYGLIPYIDPLAFERLITIALNQCVSKLREPTMTSKRYDDLVLQTKSSNFKFQVPPRIVMANRFMHLVHNLLMWFQIDRLIYVEPDPSLFCYELRPDGKAKHLQLSTSILHHHNQLITFHKHGIDDDPEKRDAKRPCIF